jgi:tetratricopeptide (TPR) repeat protein
MRRLVWLSGALIALLGVWASQPSYASDISEVLFTKGLMYYDLGRYDLAVQNLREAAREDPANLEVRKYLLQAEAKVAGKPSAVIAFEEAVKKDPKSARSHLDLAVALSMEGQNDRALTAVQEAAKLAPGNGEVLFFRGLIRLRQGAFKEAIPDLQQARAAEPRLAQGTMFYEAVALANLQEREAARGLFQKVVEVNPTTQYASEAAEQTRMAAVKRISAKVTTGVEYDTNVTLEGRHNTLGAPLDLPAKHQLRVPISALLDYRFLDVGQWSFGARYGLYASFHDQSDALNLLTNQAELYGVWQTSDLYIRPFYYYQSVFLDGNQLVDTHSVGGSIMYYAPHNLAPELFFRAQHREYNSPTFREGDPDSVNVRGEYNQYYLFQSGQGYVRGGLGFESNVADGENQDYKAFLALAGLQYQLPWQMVFNFDFEYQYRPYNHRDTLFGIERTDHQYSLAWQLTKPLWNSFDVKGRIAYIRNDSTIGDFEYNRQIYSLLFSWNY